MPEDLDFLSLSIECVHLLCKYSGLFFLTPAAEKTKTQAENSSQKLKEKTQPQGGIFLL